MIDIKEKVLLCVNASLEKKAQKLVILGVKGLSSFTDYFVILSGNSDRQVQAITEAIRDNLKKHGIIPLGVEGERNGQWVLMDYDDVVIHIFYHPVREFYDLERLWSEAPRMEVDDDLTHLSELAQGL